MVRHRISRKELKQDEILEAAFDIGHWLEQHKHALLRWGGAVLIVAVVAAGAVWFVLDRRAESRRMLAEAQRQFQTAAEAGFDNAEELDEALTLLDRVIARAGNSVTGQTARYYRGAALYRTSQLDAAIEALEAVASHGGNPPTLAASAESLLAHVYLDAGRADDAIALLSTAAGSDDAALPADQALLLLGRVHQAQGDTALAREAWQRVVDEFPQGSASSEARRLLGS